MTAPPPSAPREQVAEVVSSLWWLILLRGVVLIILGIYALLRPGMTLVAFTQVLGAFLLIDGIIAVVAGVMGWTESQGWTIARGVLGLLVGLFVLGHPVLVGAMTATIVIMVIAIQSIVGGVMEIVVAVRERKQIEGEWLLILSGGLSVVFGAILFIAPFASSLVLIRILGAFAIVFGVSLCVVSFRVRKLGRALAQS